MYAERIRKQLVHLEAVMRVNPDRITEVFPLIVRNLHNEIDALRDAEEEAFKLYLASQCAENTLN